MTGRLLMAGTDTGVGKTFVSALLCRALRASGGRVTAVKPAASGCELIGGHLVGDDTRLLAEATGESDLGRVTRWNFVEPLAPAQAARRAGTPFTLPTSPRH
jgi:dethiobiotin synthetase